MNRRPLNPEEDEVASLYRRAYELVERGQFAEARPILEECLRFNPDPSYAAPVRQELARVLEELGDSEGALHLRMEVKHLAPDRHANLWKLAQLLAELGRNDEALQEAIQATRLQPTNLRYRELVTQLRQMTRSAGSESVDIQGEIQASASDAFKVVTSTVVFGAIALFVHLKYGPFFVQSVAVDRILFACMGALLGENASRIAWLHRKKREGTLPPETLAAMTGMERKFIVFCVIGYILHKVLASPLGYGKSLMIGLLLTFGLVRWGMRRVFGTLT